jgi:TolB-like protein/tetratricopeptide (TPR) repeat protein
MTTPPDIFLSYNREDQARAKLFAEAFEGQGFKVWWDVGLRTGEAYDEVTETALRTAKAVVVLWSKKSVQSRWVRAEATLADRNKTLVPCMIEPCERPIMFELTQTAELSHWLGEASDKAWMAFVADVKRFIANAPSRGATAPEGPTLAQLVAEPLKPREPLLAVLAFDNLSSDPDMQFFSDGVAEEIMQTLMRSSGLKVIGRTSAFQFRGERKAQAAAALNATHVLDGHVRRAGPKMRVSAQLTDAATGTALWGERYDRDVSDAFALQDEIAGHVATALNRALVPAEKAPPPIDPQAYDLFIRARPALAANDQTITKGAIPMLETVVARAPRFAAGWGALAFARAASMPQWRDAEHDPDFLVTSEANGRALELEPSAPLPKVTQALLLPAFSQHGRKIALCEEALKAEPNNTLILQTLSSAYNQTGQISKSLEFTRRVVEIDPLSGPAISNYAWALAACDRLEDAQNALLTNDEMSVRGRWWLPRTEWQIAYLYVDDLDGADAFLDANAAQFSDAPSPVLRGMKRVTEVLRMALEERQEVMRRALASDRARALSLETCAFAAEAGCLDIAYEALFAALKNARSIQGALANTDAGNVRAFTCTYLFNSLGSRALRRDVRFPKLCAALGLAEFWTESGVWPDCVNEVAPYYDFKAECAKALREVALP